ncbi:transposable element Tcb2 transposase [Trichonephila clavipes]|nr:transposable element Tcb2 transposase [Trichonephila clavipes]
MPLRRFRRQYEQLSQFVKGRIIGMMKAGWSARRDARQLGSSDCVVRSDESRFNLSSDDNLVFSDESRFNLSSDDNLVFSDESKFNLSSDDNLVFSDESRFNLSSDDNLVFSDESRFNLSSDDNLVFSDESRFNLSSDDNRVRVWRPRGERLNPVFASQRHTAPTAGVMVWGAIAYNTLSPLVLIRDTMTAQRHVHDILQPHVLPLMQRHPGTIFQQDNARPYTERPVQDCHHTVTTLPWPARSSDLSPIKHIWDHFARRVVHPTSLSELESRLQQIWNVCLKTSYRTCMPQCRIVSHRAFALEGVQQGVKSSVLLPFSLK